MILDRLVGSGVGVNWPDGPLAVAAQSLDDTTPLRFGRTKPLRGGKAEIAKRLGYPILLCEAVQGAAAGLGDEDDRRRFAMTVFRAVVIPGRPKRMSSREQNLLAADVAIRAHPLLCRADCPAVLALEGAVGEHPFQVSHWHRYSAAVCATARIPIYHASWVRADHPPAVRLLHAIRLVMSGLFSVKSQGGWDSARESLRLVASERGVVEAAGLCLDIARRCGLAVEMM